MYTYLHAYLLTLLANAALNNAEKIFFDPIKQSLTVWHRRFIGAPAQDSRNPACRKLAYKIGSLLLPIFPHYVIDLT